MSETISLIPQVFYDLLGRVVPGAATLLAGALLLVDRADLRAAVVFALKDPGVPVTLLIGAGLLASYLLGTILGGLGFAVVERNLRTPDLSKLKPELPPPGEGIPARSVSYVYDFILMTDAAAGARLAKLRAEMHMCRGLMAGCIFLAVAHPIRSPASFSPGEVFLAVAGLAVACFGWYLLHSHLSVRCRHLMVNSWTLLNQRETRSAAERENLKT